MEFGHLGVVELLFPASAQEEEEELGKKHKEARVVWALLRGHLPIFAWSLGRFRQQPRRVQQVLDTEWLMGGRKHTTSNGATGKRLSAAALETVRAFYREDLELWGQAMA